MNHLIPLPQSPPMDQNPALVYLSSMPSPKSRMSQGQVIRTIASWLGMTPETVPWSALRYQHTAALRTKAIESFAPATARKYIAALRGILRHAWRLGYMTAEDYQRAIDLDPVRGETLPAGRDLSQGEINALFETCIADPSSAGPRDAAIIGMMYVTLVRRSGIVALDLEDYNPTTGQVRLHGKGNREYTAYVTNGSQTALNDWIALRGNEPGPLFLAINKSGNIRPGQRIADQAIYNLCKKRGAEAGIPHFSPHDFRRTGIGDMLDAGEDISNVGNVANQKDPKTTKRYDRRPEGIKMRAAKRLHVPYKTRITP